MKPLVLVVLALFLPRSIASQTPRALLMDGDTIQGAGRVQGLQSVSIDDNGAWLVRLETDDPDATHDLCIVRSGALAMREGMRLPAPANALHDDWRSVHVARSGDLAMSLQIRAGSIPLEGLYWNLALLALESEVLNLPPFAPNTTLQSVNVVRATADGAVLALVKVLNPGAAARPVDALLRYRVDRQGNVLQREVLATYGAMNAVLGVPLEILGTAASPEHGFAINGDGHFILPVSGNGRHALLANLDTIVAEELAPSPVPGRTWSTNAFALSRVAINDRGGVAYTGTLTPVSSSDLTNFLVVKNGEKVAQSGDVLPELSPFPLARGTPVVALSNHGDVFWRAAPTDSSSGGAAFMRNQTPLVQEGVTRIEGNRVLSVANGDECFAISPDGRFFVGRVVVQGLGDVVVLLDFGLVTKLEGCRGLNRGTLRHVGGAARVGTTVRVALDDGPAPGAEAFLFLSARGGFSPAGCGQATVHGELFLAPPYADVLVLPTWDGVNPSELALAVPSSLSLIDASFYLQGMFGVPGRFRSYDLTNALELQIGPP